MKYRLISLAGALMLLAVLGRYYAQPVLAQVRAALVSDVDNPARGFVQLRFTAQLPAGVSTPSLTFDPQYTVPAGKRLVIDTVSAFSQQLTQKQPTGGFWLLAGSAGTCPVNTLSFPFSNAIVIVPLTFQGNNVFGDFVFGGLAKVQSYLDSGQCLAIRIDHNAAVDNSVRYQVTLSGHLVSYP